MRLSFRLDLKIPLKLALVVFLLSRALFTRSTLTKCSFLLAGSRYIYDLYYEKEAISKQLYDWLLKNNYADAMLIAKWKKQGYEKVSVAEQRKNILQDQVADFSCEQQLCCLRCIQTKETNFNSTCICRVPREQLKQDQEIECVSCGCRGCSSND